MSMAVSILSSLFVFMRIVTNIIPETSLGVPVIDHFFTSTLILMALVVITNCINFRCYFRQNRPVPKWLKSLARKLKKRYGSPFAYAGKMTATNQTNNYIKNVTTCNNDVKNIGDRKLGTQPRLLEEGRSYTGHKLVRQRKVNEDSYELDKLKHASGIKDYGSCRHSERTSDPPLRLLLQNGHPYDCHTSMQQGTENYTVDRFKELSSILHSKRTPHIDTKPDIQLHLMVEEGRPYTGHTTFKREKVIKDKYKVERLKGASGTIRRKSSWSIPSRRGTPLLLPLEERQPYTGHKSTRQKKAKDDSLKQDKLKPASSITDGRNSCYSDQKPNTQLSLLLEEGHPYDGPTFATQEKVTDDNYKIAGMKVSPRIPHWENICKDNKPDIHLYVELVAGHPYTGHTYIKKVKVAKDNKLDRLKAASIIHQRENSCPSLISSHKNTECKSKHALTIVCLVIKALSVNVKEITDQGITVINNYNT